LLTPRNIALVLGATLVGAIAGWVGYKLGAMPPAPIIIHLLPAGEPSK
jgi:hypothetical protein